MLTYWIKPGAGGWVLTLAGKQILGPFTDEEVMQHAACDIARNQVDGMVSVRVMQKDASGAERPIGTYGPNATPRGPRKD